MSFLSDFFKNRSFVEIHSGLKCGVLKAMSAQWMSHLYQTPITHGLGNFADDRTEGISEQ